MKKQWIIPIVVLTGLLIYLTALRGSSPGAEARENFAQAGVSFQEGKLKEAESRYLTLIGNGQKSSAIFYNLALTQEALEKPGNAILNLEKATILDSGDEEIESKLAELRKNTGSAQLDAAPFWHALPGNSWAVIGGLAVLVLVMLPLSRIFKFSFGTPRTIISASVGCLVLIGASAFVIRSQHQFTQNRSIVLNADTPLRVSPFEDAESQQSLPAGKVVRAGDSDSHDGFRLVETTEGTSGWLKESEFAAISETL